MKATVVRRSGWIALALFFWSCAVALQAGSYPASVVALALAWTGCWLALPALGRIGWNRETLGWAVVVIGPLWFAGFDSPFHWDAVYSAVRAQLFWDTGYLERFSIFYVALSPFVSWFPATSIPAHLFVMTLGIATLAGVGLLSARLAGRDWGTRIALIAAVLPPFYVLYRWVYLDTFLAALWTWTLVAALAWSRRLTARRAVVLFLLVILTSLAKETGALILIPVASALWFLAPADTRKRRLPLLLAIIALGLLAAALVLLRYAALRGIDSYFSGFRDSHQGVTFLPFNNELPQPWTSYISYIGRQNALIWVQAGLVVPIIFAVVRPRVAWAGILLTGLGAAAQLLWIFTSRPHTWAHNHVVYTPARHPHEFLLFKLFFVVLILLWIARKIRIRVSRTMWVLTLAIAPGLLALVCFVKTNPDSTGIVHVWVDWRYHVVLLIAGLALAARGLRNAAKWPLPSAIRLFAKVVILLFILGSTLHSVDAALRFRRVDLARAEAYRWMQQHPERIVYTHWPFLYLPERMPESWKTDSRNGAANPERPYVPDVGPLAWRSGGWDTRYIWWLPQNEEKFPEDALFLWDVYRDYSLPLEFLKRIVPQTQLFNVSEWRLGLLSFRMIPQTAPAIVVGYEDTDARRTSDSAEPEK